MPKIYPIKFLDSYQREDKDFFFGRKEEIESLYEMIFQTRILLIYGTSGTGKTSLIQCGLANKFQSYDWSSLYIRRGSNIISSLDKTLCEKSNGKFVYNDQNEPDIADLNEKLKAVYKATFKPIYLIFDQFEELYVLGNKTEQLNFIAAVKEILAVEQPVKIIISIREEYLGYLFDFEKEVPELTRKKLRVEPMNLGKVTTVIKCIGNAETSNITLQDGAEETIAECIFEKIRGDEKTLTIQLPYLQVFLDNLYLKITNDETRTKEAIFTIDALEKIGNIGDVLRNFLDEQVLMTSKKLEQKPETIWKILSPFVTLDGTKEPLSTIQLFERFPDEPKELITQVIQAFVNSRILRFTEKEQLYEIAHDSLAKQVNAKRSDEEIAILEVQRLVKSQVAVKPEAREFFTERQLLFIVPYLDKFTESEEEALWIEKSKSEIEKQKKITALLKEQELERTKKRLLRSRILLGVSALALVVALGYGIKSKRAEMQTEMAKEKADSSLKKANKLTDAFYFYADRFALAFKEEQFYFIDKNGDEVEKLGKWEKAEQFDYIGLAIIKKSKESTEEYLLDTTGATYKVAYDIHEMDTSTRAIYMLYKDYVGFPMPALKNKALQVMILSGYSFPTLPSQLGEMNNLKFLELSGNATTKIPKEIGKLKTLSLLNLSFNEIDSLPKEIGGLENLKSLHLYMNKLKHLPKEIGNLKNLATLDLSENQLIRLPEEIGKLKSLKSLALIGNHQLTNLPAEIWQLEELTTLNLSENQFTSLPEGIDTLKKLTTLDLSNNQLESLPKEIGNLIQLTYLNISGNKLKSLPKEIGKLENLTTLILSRNQLTNLPKEIGELKNLTTFLLDENQITILPKEIGELEKLSYLGLDSNKLKTLPLEIGDLKNLTYLFVSSNQLTALPKEIGELKNLSFLGLGNNQLISLPKETGNLKTLKDLLVGGNKLKDLPKEVGKLNNLNTLYLYNNQLKNLPEEFRGLINLTTLFLDDNQLTSLPQELGGLQKLTILYLTHNQLTTLPQEIGALKNLTDLGLKDNQIKTLPAGIGNLNNLTALYLENNLLTSLPKEIGALKNLTTLDVSGNQLTRLPDEIGGLEGLESLTLKENQLNMIPTQIGGLKNLNYLDFTKNKLTSLPKEIGELKNLYELFLDDNPIPRIEIAKIHKLLPYCEVYENSRE